MNTRKYKYDVALSFAGEDRDIVENFVKLLKERDISVFYDYDEQSDLWGKDLYQFLDDIYANQSQFFIPVVSENYPQKLWTMHELRSAQSRAFREKSEYILPLRLDDTEISGIPQTIGYIDLRYNSLEKIVNKLIDKINLLNDRPITIEKIEEPDDHKGSNAEDIKKDGVDDYRLTKMLVGAFMIIIMVPLWSCIIASIPIILIKIITMFTDNNNFNFIRSLLQTFPVLCLLIGIFFVRSGYRQQSVTGFSIGLCGVVEAIIMGIVIYT